MLESGVMRAGSRQVSPMAYLTRKSGAQRGWPDSRRWRRCLLRSSLASKRTGSFSHPIRSFEATADRTDAGIRFQGAGSAGLTDETLPDPDGTIGMALPVPSAGEGLETGGGNVTALPATALAEELPIRSSAVDEALLERFPVG